MAAEPENGGATGPQSARQHWLGFLVSGGLAFTVDAAVLEAGVRMLGLSPLVARGLAIAIAMVVAWAAHRHWTFRVDAPPSLREFWRFVAAASSAAIMNYALYAAVLLAWPATHRLTALVAATAGSMIYSYIAMRYSVFRRR